MGFGSGARVVAVAPALCALALGLAALAGCGGSDDAAPAVGTGPTHHSRAGAPPSFSGSAGALAAPPRSRSAHRRFVRRVDAACDAGPALSASSGGTIDPAQRAHLLLTERDRLRALEHALGPIRVPHADVAEMVAYRRALRAQILLDGIVARGLLPAADEDGQGDPGVEAGERQNDFNRAARTRIARRLGLSGCLAA